MLLDIQGCGCSLFDPEIASVKLVDDKDNEILDNLVTCQSKPSALFTHARSGMSLTLPAIFLFLFLLIIFCVAIVHFQFMALEFGVHKSIHLRYFYFRKPPLLFLKKSASGRP